MLKMKHFFRSLFGRIALIFLILILTISLTQVYLTLRSCNEFMIEADQRVNLSLADNLSQVLQPYLSEPIDYAGIDRELNEFIIDNPEIDIYLLDDSGKILTCFTDRQQRFPISNVSLSPIHHFLKHTQGLPILGDDPHDERAPKPFSVAPVRLGNGENGFLYVLLEDSMYESIAYMVTGSKIVRGALLLLGVTFFFSFLVGLLAFSLVTRRVHKMTEVVQRFEQGDLDQRIPVASNDEVGQLGKAFNQMADTISINLEEIHRQEQFRRDLIANISHDLRSPLASIQGYLELVLLKNEEFTSSQRRYYLEKLFNNAQQLNRLVEELFELSKLEARQVQLNPEPFCLTELVHDVVLSFKPRAETANIRLHCDIAEQLPMVYGDIGMIEKALSRLIDNALTYTPENGEVTITMAKEGAMVSVKVSDTGSGIPEEDLPYVFERFYRVDKSRSRAKTIGAGLGLALTKKILELHNMAISVTSARDKGTDFMFYLPVHA